MAELESDTPTAKRAQYEAFEFALEAPGVLRVTNGSYGDDEKGEHTYRVNVESGVPIACECPSDTYQDGACKHRVAIAICEPVLEPTEGEIPSGDLYDLTQIEVEDATESARAIDIEDGPLVAGADGPAIEASGSADIYY